MTVREYNHVHLPKHDRALSFIHNLEHAISKCGAQDEAMRQLELIGWSEETKNVIKHALALYHRELKEDLRFGEEKTDG